MIIVQNSIVSDDIADRLFCCDCTRCHGACCVDGDSGAPLLESEVAELERVLPQALPLLTPEGRQAVEQQGVAVRDAEGDLGTPLIEGGACAFIAYAPDGTALCALQHLYKPVSCHLYPIRVQDYGEFTAVNYHRWDICRPAEGHGEPLYRYLKEPLVRRFGQAWYDELIEQINLRDNNG
ncbi:MAG: DUF3109 family protein [Bacteroidales bacterium]|nr:DUF3109 family protein [Bacteroidales bacterium]